MHVHGLPPKDPGKVRQIPCSERVRLLRAYADASARLSDLVAALARSALSMKLSFDGAWCACEEARSVCGRIQGLIYQHLQDHHCALEIAREPLPKSASATTRASRPQPLTDGRRA